MKNKTIAMQYLFIRSEKDYSISGRSSPPPSSGVVSAAPLNSIQKMLSLTSVRFIDLLPLFFVASGMKRTRTPVICDAFTLSAVSAPLPLEVQV